MTSEPAFCAHCIDRPAAVTVGKWRLCLVCARKIKRGDFRHEHAVQLQPELPASPVPPCPTLEDYDREVND